MCPSSHELRRMVEQDGCSPIEVCEHFGIGSKALHRWIAEHKIMWPQARLSLDGEEWKPAVNWEGRYEVSSFGRVRSIGRPMGETAGRFVPERILKPYLNRMTNPYWLVNLSKNGRRDAGGVMARLLIHRLVLEAFVGPCPNGMQACHNNGNSLDNRIENLRWDTAKANMRDQIKHGTHHSLQRS